jgi:hypothetical protein
VIRIVLIIGWSPILKAIKQELLESDFSNRYSGVH